MAIPFTPNQAEAGNGAVPFNPTFGSSKAALSHSNGIMSALTGMGGAYTNLVSNISTGVAKTELSQMQGLGNLVAKPLASAMGDKGQVGIPDATLQTQGTGEKLGAAALDTGEFFAPGGAEKSVAEKAAPYIDKIPDLLGMTGKAASAVTGTIKTALQGLISGTSMGGVTAAQGGDVKSGAELGGAAGGLSGAVEAFGPEIGKALQTSDFKLSPQQEAKATSKVSSAAKFMTDNKILGSDETKFKKLDVLNNSLESTLQSSLPKDLTVPKQAVEDNINATVEKLKTDDPAIYNSAKKDAQNAISLMKSSEGDSVSVQDALKSKRSYGKAAFKQGKFAVKDPNVVSEGSYAVEQGFQKALSDTLDSANATIKIPSSLSKFFGGASETSLQDFNKVYSNAITSKNLTSLSRFKNDSGMLGRFFGLWAGEAVGQAISPGLGGKLVGAGVGEVASQHLPGLMRRAGERIAASPQVITGVAKVDQASQDSGQ